jgi:hypothetical protein
LRGSLIWFLPCGHMRAGGLQGLPGRIRTDRLR